MSNNSHTCPKLKSNESCFKLDDDDGTWHFVQSHELQIENIDHCPRCGYKLNRDDIFTLEWNKISIDNSRTIKCTCDKCDEWVYYLKSDSNIYYKPANIKFERDWIVLCKECANKKRTKELKNG